MVLEDLDPDSLAMMQDMLLAMDPPRHAEHRESLSAHFRARVIAGLEPSIRAVCGEIIDAAGDGAVEAVHQVCSSIPSQVIGELVGIPVEDREKIHSWAEAIVSGEADSLNGSIAMAMYAMDLAAARRGDPRDDLVTLLLDAEFDGEPMTDLAFGSFFVQLVVAGNDTSRTLLSTPSWRCCSTRTSSPSCATRPVAAAGRGRGGAALGQPAALLPPHRQRGHRAVRRPRSPRATSWR